MNPDASIIQLLLIGGLGSLAGYLGRIVQKFDDKKDDIYLKFLPSLNYNIFSLKESVRFFLEDTNLKNLRDSIQKINMDLNQQVFSGEILYLEEYLRNLLLDLYNNSKNFERMMNKLSDDDAGSLKLAFEREEVIEKIVPAKLLSDAENIKLSIESELKKYNSISLYLIIVVFLLGAAVAIIEFLKQ